MTKKKHQRNSYPAFTVIEVALVVALIGITLFFVPRLYGVYAALAVRCTVDQLAATSAYLAECAVLQKKKTWLCVKGARAYSWYDGTEHKEYTLPFGVEWGALPGVYGPPSRPQALITSAVVGGGAHHDGVALYWDEGGAGTPATCYVQSGRCCGAVSISRAAAALSTSWRLVGNQWFRF